MTIPLLQAGIRLILFKFDFGGVVVCLSLFIG